MFQFGLLSSFIPYILVAVLYILGMTSYAKGILYGEAEENTTENEISIDSNESDSKENISFYTNVCKQTVEKILHFLDHTEDDTIIRFYKNDSIKESLFYSHRFCRPPPILS